MAFLGITCASALRAGLSVAIVAMVNHTAVSDDVITTISRDTDQCPRDTTLHSTSGEFTWNRNEQGAVLAAFYYGQLTQVYTCMVKLGSDNMIGNQIFTNCTITVGPVQVCKYCVGDVGHHSHFFHGWDASPTISQKST